MLTAMDQIGEAQNKLKKSVASASPGNLLRPKEWDTFNLDFSFKELLRFLDPNHQGPLFVLGTAPDTLRPHPLESS